MKAIMSVMFVMIMAFALVVSVEAGTCSSCSHNSGPLCKAFNTLAGGTSNGLEGNHADSLSTPVAYSDYVDGREIPVNARIRTPETMGSW
jgi:hypothetical protein